MELHKYLRKEKGFPVDVYVEYGVVKGVKNLISIKDVSDYVCIDNSIVNEYIRDTPVYIFNGIECVTFAGLFNLFMNLREHVCPSGKYAESEEVDKLFDKFAFLHDRMGDYIKENNN